MIKKVQGFTLIELVISMVIIAVGLSGCIFALTTATKLSADPMIKQQASSIAKSYLEEILNKNFPNIIPCPIYPANNRAIYTNICDYNGLLDLGVKDQTGAAVTSLSAYNVKVNIETQTAALNPILVGSGVVRIDVTVSHALLATPMLLSAYKTNY